MTDIQTVHGAFAYDTQDGSTYILHLNNALDFTSSMQHSILCTNQARMNNVQIQDVPKTLDSNSSFSIYFPSSNIEFPLEMIGPVPYLPVRYPSDSDLHDCLHLDLTEADYEWDPTVLDTTDRGVSAFITSDFDLSAAHQSLASLLMNAVIISSVKHYNRRDITPSYLADLWQISLEAAKATLQATSQESLRVLEGNVQRRVKTKTHHRYYHHLSGYHADFCTDTFKANVLSTRGNKYAQVFCNRANYTKCYPIKRKSDAPDTLNRFLHEVGVPTELLSDGAKEQFLGEWGRITRLHKIRTRRTEPHSPWQNPAELTGGILKRAVRNLMRRTNTPIRLWDYCWEFIAEIRNITASPHPMLDSVTPYEKIHGYTPNISEFLMFKWYQWIHYYDPEYPDRDRLGRYLGPAHSASQGFAHYVLSDKGKVVVRSTVSRVTDDEASSPEMKHRMAEFTSYIEDHIGNHSKATLDHCEEVNDDPYLNIFPPDELDDEDIAPQETDENGNIVNYIDIDDYVANDSPLDENQDKFIGMKVNLPRNGEMIEGTVVSRKRNADGTLIGTSHPNPYLDSRVYHVEFGDSNYQDYAANILIENLHNQIDSAGRTFDTLKAIIDHTCDTNVAISKENGSYTTKYGVTRKVITTKGWKLKAQWSNGTSSWIPLSILKESNPIEVAEYSVAKNIHDEPAFAWWVPHTLRKRENIIKKVAHRIPRKNMKFGIVVPSSLEEAKTLDELNGNNLWAAAIEKEKKNVIIAFNPLRDDESIPVGSKKINYHFVFDVKSDLTRKARCVAGGHVNKRNVPSYAKYSSVATRDSVRICFLIAALNDLDILSADIGNAYLNAPCREKVHVILGPELFGEEMAGKPAIIVRALYGLATAGAAWWDHLSNFITNELGYETTRADPDVYRKAMRKEDGEQYYSYLVIYVDDVLCIHHNPKQVMDAIHAQFRLKGAIEEPSTYLGNDIRKWKHQDQDGQQIDCWALGSEKYCKEAIRVCDQLMKDNKVYHTSTRRNGGGTPFSNVQYRPELDATESCNDNLTTMYQNLIGILRWLCELGRIDILYETAVMSQYLSSPRIGHLQQVLNIFHYLKLHKRSWMALDPTDFDIEWKPRSGESSPQENAIAMKKIYKDCVDEIPPNAPIPLGRAVRINAFVDSDHAGNQVTRRSHTGILIMLNSAPIIWFSKRQNTVESSTFGSEFIALKICTELIEGLIYKLRMFGIPINGPARVFCDNEAVVKSSSLAESTLKKKHCSIAFHRVRESVAAGKLLIYYEKSSSNLADLFTKSLSAEKRHTLIRAILN